MAKKSSVLKNERRAKMNKSSTPKRKRLKEILMDKTVTQEERFEAQLKLAEMPRNSSKTRIRNRCAMTGRPRGTFRKFGLARNKIREIAMRGEIPGMIKASW
jgi:small subunit ribosomal protein S14